MTTPDKGQINVPLLIIAFVGVILAAILLKRLFVAILLLLLVVMIFGGSYMIFRMLKENRRQKMMAETIEGNIIQNIEGCQFRLGKNKTEIAAIEKNITDIEQKLDSKLELKSYTKEESEKLITAFQNQKTLRETRLAFYSDCKSKLETLLYNQEILKDLEEKKKKLSEFQKDGYDEIAKMEEMNANLEYDKHFLESIESLSSRMELNDDLDDALEIKLELETLTKELRRL